MSILAEKGRVWAIIGDISRDFNVIFDEGRLADPDVPLSTIDSRYEATTIESYLLTSVTYAVSANMLNSSSSLSS